MIWLSDRPAARPEPAIRRVMSRISGAVATAAASRAAMALVNPSIRSIDMP
jgi:hypothetical protein